MVTDATVGNDRFGRHPGAPLQRRELPAAGAEARLQLRDANLARADADLGRVGAPVLEVDGKLYKEYYGSASDFNKGEYRHVEGKRILEPVKGKLADTLREMEEDIQSSISYAGGRKLMDIRKVNYVILGGDNAGEHLLM